MGKQHGSCWWCVKAFKWIPVIFILTIVCWSYYAYVVQLCYYTIESYVQKLLYLFFFHIMFFMFLWSYWQTVVTDLIPVPDMFRVPAVEMEKLQQAQSDEAQAAILEILAQNLPITNRTIRGAIRFCDKCQIIKPDRAHHCSVCRSCVLKMDHHCPWVNNCVAYHNYKFFILFLAYALLYCVFIAVTTLQYFIQFWKAFRPPVFRLGKDKDGFNIGKYSNFQEVFGDSGRLWFIPVFSSLGNGVVYPVRAQHQSGPNTYNSMGSTQNRFIQEMTLVEEATILALGAG
ncbi:hypothetical protein PV326_010468 [Microctonus aethiopoides]|nr:hypothetical protein PV326_010468 [Microctonus aethiopoides]